MADMEDLKNTKKERFFPTKYTPEIGMRICDMIATSSMTLKQICDSDEDFPQPNNLFLWMHKYPEFMQQYLAAKETQGIVIAENILNDAYACPAIPEEIAKQNHVFRVAQWHLAKLAPRHFGDKKEVKSEMNISVHEQDLAHLK